MNDSWDCVILRADNPTDKGLMDVAIERYRQINDEGWTAEHDRLHESNALAAAGAVYALWPYLCRNFSPEYAVTSVEIFWPFEPEWFKPKTRRQDFVRAAALIIAEIDRMDALALEEHQ